MPDENEMTGAADEIQDALGSEDGPADEPSPAGESTAAQPPVAPGDSRADRRIQALANEARELRERLARQEGRSEAMERMRTQQTEQPPDPDDELGMLRYEIRQSRQELARQGQLLARQEAERVRGQLRDQAIDGLAFTNVGFARRQVELFVAATPGATPAQVRAYAEELAGHLGSGTGTPGALGKAPAAPPAKGKEYVDAKAKAAAATARPATASGAPPQPPKKELTYEEKLAKAREAGVAQIAAARGR